MKNERNFTQSPTPSLNQTKVKLCKQMVFQNFSKSNKIVSFHRHFIKSPPQWSNKQVTHTHTHTHTHKREKEKKRPLTSYFLGLDLLPLGEKYIVGNLKQNSCKHTNKQASQRSVNLSIFQLQTGETDGFDK